jgi:hypothetical protein
MRDHLGDLGEVAPPPAVDLYPVLRNRSPDLLLRRVHLADASAEFGAAAWTQDFDSDRAHAANYVYARALSDGLGPDSGEMLAFWSEPSPFLHPKYWMPLVEPVALDELAPQHVAVARFKGVLPEGTNQHVSLIGGLACAREGVALPSPALATRPFLDFLAGHNHVAFRSVQLEPQEGEAVPRFLCHLRGVPEGPKLFRFTLKSFLPVGTTVKLSSDGPIHGTPAWSIAPLAPYDGPIVQGSTSIGLGIDEVVVLKMEVHLPAGAAPGRYETTLDQWMGGRHLGRITFIVQVPI